MIFIIAGIPYTVIELSDDEISLKSGEKGDMGLCLFDEQKILIKKELPPEVKKETLLHEITESINSHYGLHLKHDKIDALANAWYNFFKDNNINL